MALVRRGDRVVHHRGPGLPSLQRLVDGDNGSTRVTVLINTFVGDQNVPTHRHDVEEILVVTAGECLVTVGGLEVVALSGDAVIVEPGVDHSIGHQQSGEPCTVVAILGSPDVTINTGTTLNADVDGAQS